MATYIQNPGLDIREFDPNIPLLETKQEFRNAARSGAPNFLRSVAVLGSSLMRSLEIADEEFQAIADRCGAQVVGHQFGLYSVQPDRFYRSLAISDDILPKGFLLAAQVDTIHFARRLDPISRIRIWNKTSDYDIELVNQTKGRPKLFDIGAGQFARGRPEFEQQGIWFIDPEPKVAMYPGAG